MPLSLERRYHLYHCPVFPGQLWLQWWRATGQALWLCVIHRLRRVADQSSERCIRWW